VNWRTPTARAVYWVGGLLTKIKTYQQTYSYEFDEDAGYARFPEAGRRWTPIGFAFTVLDWSERLDPRHWEHWALDHSDCELEVGPVGSGSPCSQCGWCGGVTCYRDAVGGER
jgi:hypothetical protein